MLCLIEHNKYSLLENIGREDCLNEYKEFFLKNNYDLNDINDFLKGFLNTKTLKNIYKTILDYIDKYSIKYLISLSNIDKLLLPNFKNNNYSKFYIGVSDNGYITGIPIEKNRLDDIKNMLQTKLNSYYDNFIGLHATKGSDEIQIGYYTYYDFNKIIKILKNHTKIKITILDNTNIHNKKLDKLLSYIEEIKKEESEYQNKKKFYENQIKIKTDYNNRYSQKFYQLIRSDVMIEFKEYCNISNKLFDKILFKLQSKITKRDEVYNYLIDGEYKNNSLYPNNFKKDQYYGKYIKRFLDQYKEFKNIKLKQNIEVKKLKKKSPLKKLNGYLNDISCFNQYLSKNKDITFIKISIWIPIIKDKNVFLGFKNDDNVIKIIQRSFDNQPFTTI